MKKRRMKEVEVERKNALLFIQIHIWEKAAENIIGMSHSNDGYFFFFGGSEFES
jgi:hypothetical protein